MRCCTLLLLLTTLALGTGSGSPQEGGQRPDAGLATPEWSSADGTVASNDGAPSRRLAGEGGSSRGTQQFAAHADDLVGPLPAASPQPDHASAAPANETCSAKAFLDSYIALCTIVKDQPEDLVEWIEWHSCLGVRHFYVRGAAWAACCCRARQSAAGAAHRGGTAA
jgi:hypothetical protein